MAVDVLLVDDDVIQVNTRKAILESAGLSVAVSENGGAALEFLYSQNGIPIRMVITDHLMPGMNGPEFVAALRRDGFLGPVLVLSGYADVEDEYLQFSVAFRVKPFPPEQLIALVQYLLSNSERRTA